MSLAQLLRKQAADKPGCLSYALLDRGEQATSLSFAQLELQARAIGARLQHLGAQGERVLLLYPSSLDYILAFYGCLMAGAVAVPAYPPRMNRNLPRLLSILEDAQPTVVLTTEPVLKGMHRWFEEAPSLAKPTWVVSSEIEAAEADRWRDPEADESSLAFLQYTSASTAEPKGVMVTHGNLLHNQRLMQKALGHGPHTVIVSWLPLFHDMGLIGNIVASLYNGVPCHLMTPVDFLKRPRRWLEAISRYGGTFSGGPDFAYQLCVEKVGPEAQEGLDLRSWECAYNGSEPVRAETLRRFADAFAPSGFRPRALLPCYGLAEHTLFATGNFQDHPAHTFSRPDLEQNLARPSAEHDAIELVSCGGSCLDCEVAIAEPETGRRCGQGEVGEIWLAGPSVAAGYWLRPELTEHTFAARLEDGSGPFLRTGDLGFLLQGELYVTGRLKDLIILRGRNLIPQDIEQLVERCEPALRPAHVAAVSVEAGGAERLVVAAEVRREARQHVDPPALVAEIRSQVAASHGVDVSALVLLKPNGMPKTSSGKIQRAKVAQEFLDGTLRSLHTWRDESTFANEQKRTESDSPVTESQLQSWLSERLAARLRCPIEAMDLDRSIASFGLDSVVLVALISEIEEGLGVDLPLDELLGEELSLRQMAQRLSSRRAGLPENGMPKASVVPIVDKLRHRSANPALDTTATIDVSSSISGHEPVNANRAHLTVVSGSETDRGSEKDRDSQAARGNGLEPEHSEAHPYRRCVNPELGRALAQMAMDKTFVRGQGSWLWDQHGRRYLDFLAQYGALPFGFNPDRVWSALYASRERHEPSFVQPSYADAAGQLAQRLLAAAPAGLAYVTYANSGAEANEAAIKLCRSSTGRRDILAAGNGFHGKTMGALSATDRAKYQEAFGMPVAGFDYVPYGDIEVLRQALESRRYAGFLVEPLQGEGGIIEPPAGYLRLALKACRSTGTLLIADEVQTGLGRTGSMFACLAEGITPDVMTLAKALGGGLMPIGACLSTAAAYNDDFALKHTSTFAGNALACRAGLATLDLLEEDDGALVDHVAATGARLKDGLQTLQRRFPEVLREVRGRGFLLGLSFGLDRYSVDSGLLGYLGEQDVLTAMVVSHLLDIEGVRVGYALNRDSVMRIEPPLNATWEECQYFLSALERVLLRLRQRNLAALTAHVTGHTDSLQHEQGEKTNGQAEDSEPNAPVGFGPQFAPEAKPRSTRSPTTTRPWPASSNGEGRFAFLVHPLALSDYSDLDCTLNGLSARELNRLSTAIADNFDPLVIGETRVVARDGRSAYGEFILLPRQAEELKDMAPSEAQAEVRTAAKVAQGRGARIIGLGAYTSVVTHGGVSLKSAGLPPLTTGNSYTAVAANTVVRAAAEARHWDLREQSIAVLGAGGSIGQAVSILLTRDCGRLILLGNPAHPEASRQRLLQVVGRLVWSLEQLANAGAWQENSVADQLSKLDLSLPVRPDRANLARLGQQVMQQCEAVTISTDAASQMSHADVVVCATSSTEQLVDARNLRAGAVICDVSRPANVGPEVQVHRPDVTVVDGGVVRMPGDATLGFNLSLDPGQAYACMAETMMLAIEQRYRNASMGYDIELSSMLEMEELAQTLGFEVVLGRGGQAPVQSGPNLDEQLAPAAP